MKRKLIEMHLQENLIVCDNIQCDYKVKSLTGNPNEDIRSFINKPCPKCGENLLSEQDYTRSRKVLRVINWLNRWFSWTMFFVPKDTKVETITIHCHNGIKIETINEKS